MYRTIVEPIVWMYGFQNVWQLGYQRIECVEEKKKQVGNDIATHWCTQQNVWREKKYQVGNDIATHWCNYFLLFERLKNN